VTRISTYASQQIAQHQMLRTREETDRLLQQTSSARRAASFSELGVDTGRALNAHALLDQLDGQDWVNKSVQTQLELYNNRMGEIDDTMEGLRQELWKAVSTNNALSLTQQIKNAFETFRTSLNAEDDGRKLFAGANTEDDAFKPKTLDDLAALPDVDLGKAYGNDQVRRAGRVGDGISFEFGILASDLGTDFLQAFKSLQSLGDLPDKRRSDRGRREGGSDDRHGPRQPTQDQCAEWRPSKSGRGDRDADNGSHPNNHRRGQWARGRRPAAGADGAACPSRTA
jgi:flagellar hook-associated protein 3 FlgL